MHVFKSYLDGYEIDWRLRGRAPRTVAEYRRYLNQLFVLHEEPALVEVLAWLETFHSSSCQRQAARAIRSFGKYLDSLGRAEFVWWKTVPLRAEEVLPQNTVLEKDVQAARSLCRTSKERALIEVLWS
ncbi:MAG: hypothetical protein RLZZ579_1074, partial [Actinomycetota bacterium]